MKVRRKTDGDTPSTVMSKGYIEKKYHAIKESHQGVCGGRRGGGGGFFYCTTEAASLIKGVIILLGHQKKLRDQVYSCLMCETVLPG